MQLKEMEIEDCNMMTEVVTGDGAGIEDAINFKNLKGLELIIFIKTKKVLLWKLQLQFPIFKNFKCCLLSQDEDFLFNSGQRTDVTRNRDMQIINLYSIEYFI